MVMSRVTLLCGTTSRKRRGRPAGLASGNLDRMHYGSVHIISPGYTKQKGNVRMALSTFSPGVLRWRGLPIVDANKTENYEMTKGER